MGRILTPDNPDFFVGPEDEVQKRIYAFLGSIGQKYSSAEERIFEEWEQFKYERKIVDCVEWLNSDQYFGRTGKRTFEVLKEDFYRVMGKEPRPMRLILKGGIGWGKTFFSALIMARLIYELSCLRSPQAHYGLSLDSKMVFMSLSVTKSHARRVLFTTLKEMMDSSTYFINTFQRNVNTNTIIEFPQKGIYFQPGSGSELAPLGENLFGGVIEEANFFPIVVGSKKIANPDEKEYDAVKKLQDSVWRRIKSRYQVYGRVPGMLVLNSSSRYPDDYLERLEKESDPNETMVVHHAEWETKPLDKYSGNKMLIFMGDAQRMPKIIDNEAELPEWKARGEILEVPIEYKWDFEKDIVGALRDIAGRNVRAVDRFFADDARIDAMFESGKDIPRPFHNRFESGIACNELDVAVHPINLVKQEGRLDKEAAVLRWHPQAGRFCHIDLSVVGDATGFCICHVGEVREIEKRMETEEGAVEIIREFVPEIYVDVLLRIVPPERGEIEFEAIRDLIHRFSEETGMRFIKITFDQYQSRGTQQLLKKRFGEDVVQALSVDRTPDAYIALKEVIYEKRLHTYFYAPLSVELRQLHMNPRSRKIDHPPHGSKDVADALAGAVFNASKDFDKGVTESVVFGKFEDEPEREEDIDQRMAAWLLGLGNVESLEKARKKREPGLAERWK